MGSYYFTLRFITGYFWVASQILAQSHQHSIVHETKIMRFRYSFQPNQSIQYNAMAGKCIKNDTKGYEKKDCQPVHNSLFVGVNP